MQGICVFGHLLSVCSRWRRMSYLFRFYLFKSVVELDSLHFFSGCKTTSSDALVSIDSQTHDYLQSKKRHNGETSYAEEQVNLLYYIFIYSALFRGLATDIYSLILIIQLVPFIAYLCISIRLHSKILYYVLMKYLPDVGNALRFFRDV